MEYRLFVETVPGKGATGWSFMFYNHQDFNVYKFCGKSDSMDEKAVILEVTAKALTYFSNFMRRRYYDEHFATILDEDYVTVYTEIPDIAAVFASKSYQNGFTGADSALWEALVPFLSRPTMRFADPTEADAEFTEAARALAASGLEK